MPNYINNIKANQVQGSIYSSKRDNLLIVKVKKKTYHTGLKDTPNNRKLAEQIKIKMFLELHGLSETAIKHENTIKDIFNQYIENHCINLDETTIRGYNLAFKRIIKTDCKIDKEIIENKVIEFIKTEKKLSPASINIYLRAFQIFLNYLKDKEYLPAMKIFKHYKINHSEKEIKIYSDDEINKLLEYFKMKDIEFMILLQLQLFTGMRIGECLKLERKNIKEDRIILENKTVKTAEFVIITPELRDLLLSLPNRKKLFRWSENSYSRLTRRFHDAFKELNINRDNRSFHELRKTYLRKLFDNETPVQVAQKLMRHKNITVTIQNYTKLTDAEMIKYASAVQKIDKK